MIPFLVVLTDIVLSDVKGSKLMHGISSSRRYPNRQYNIDWRERQKRYGVTISTTIENSTHVPFNRMDIDKDGVLEMQEFDFLFYNLDANGNRNITRNEFNRVWTHRYQTGNKRVASKLFNALDINDDGLIQLNNLPHLFTMFDLDDNGEITFQEFDAVYHHFIDKHH